jgi:hypothetical protein
MKMHYLGYQFVALIRATANNVMETAFYDGKSQTFTFERYCKTLKLAFTAIDGTRGLRENYGSPSKYYRNSLVQCKVVLASPNLQTYSSAVHFTAQFLDQRQSLNSLSTGRNNTRNISAFNRSYGGGRGSYDSRAGPRSAGRTMYGRGRGGRWDCGGRSTSKSKHDADGCLSIVGRLGQINTRAKE